MNPVVPQSNSSANQENFGSDFFALRALGCACVDRVTRQPAVIIGICASHGNALRCVVRLREPPKGQALDETCWFSGAELEIDLRDPVLESDFPTSLDPSMKFQPGDKVVVGRAFDVAENKLKPVVMSVVAVTY